MNANTIGSTSIQQIEVSKKIFYVKYLVCLRDKLILRSELNKLSIHFEISVYGGIEIQGNITENVLTMLQKGLLKNRLFLLDESESAQIDKLIKTIIEIIHYSELLPKTNFADSVIKKFTSNGDHIGKVFTEVMGVSIQKFIDLQKIERVKELLLFEDLSLSAIAELLDYKSKTNLSVQFKKITGLNLTYFRQIKKEREKLAKV